MAFNHRKTITFRLAQTARAARGRSGGHLVRIGLHPGQESVLKALAEQDGLTMSQLAQTLSVQPPTVTKIFFADDEGGLHRNDPNQRELWDSNDTAADGKSAAAGRD